MRKINGRISGWVCGLTLVVAAGPAVGQRLSDRIDAMHQKHSRQAAAAEAELEIHDIQVNRRLARRMSFSTDAISARDALESWSRRTGIPMAIDWNAMEIDGVDPDLELELKFEDVKAEVILLFIMDGMSLDLKFIAEAHPWGIHMRSKLRANQDVITRVYDVTDLVVDVPQFTDAPSMDLTEALSNTSSGGGGSGGGGGEIFNVEDFDDEDRTLTKRERGELLIQLVRDTIEPEVWQENGGEFSRIRYRQGRMIVRAPLYVHMQIGRAAIE